jgi:hypothetical protein
MNQLLNEEFEMDVIRNNPTSNQKSQWTFWRILGSGIGWIIKTTTILVLIVIHLPPIYFAWRTSRPMELPEFGDKSFYQILAERQQEYAAHEEVWRLTHHGEYPDHYRGMCFDSEAGFVLLIVKPSMDYVLIRHILTPNDPYTSLPANVHYQTILDYLPASWTLFEMGALNIYQYIPHDFDAAIGPHHGECIIPPPECGKGGF